MSRVNRVIEDAKDRLSFGAEKIDVVAVVTNVLDDIVSDDKLAEAVASYSASVPIIIIDEIPINNAKEKQRIKEIYSIAVFNAVSELVKNDDKFEAAVKELSESIADSGKFTPEEVDDILSMTNTRTEALSSLVVLMYELDRDSTNYIETAITGALTAIAAQYKNGLKVIDALAGYFLAPVPDNEDVRNMIISKIESEVVKTVIHITTGGCHD